MVPAMSKPAHHHTSSLFLAALVAASAALAVVFVQPTQAAGPARYIAPPAWILGPMQGRDADEKTFNDILNHLDQSSIPITAFHFDFDGWETCPNNAQFAWSNAVLQRMRSHNPPIRALFWILPLLKKGCAEFDMAQSRGYLVRNGNGSTMVTSSWQGTGGWIDFKNPQAVVFWHSLLERIITRAPGVIGGFYTDDVRPDLPNDPSYSDAFVRDLVDYTRVRIPDGDVVFKRYGANTPDDATLSRYAHAVYVNDLDSAFSGLQEGIRRVFATASLVPAPFNEFTGYADNPPDAETYIRRMQWGAYQPVMENDNLPVSAYPWDSHYPPQVMQAYQYYSTLHWELVPFLHTYDELAYLNNWSIFQQADAAHFSTMLGREIFVQYITNYMQSAAPAAQVTLPLGQWINYWNEQQVITGPATVQIPVPLGREPVFIANGAIIPMQVRDGSTGHGTPAAAGALTVNVFPSGHSTFSYFDLSQKWVGFDVRQNGSTLTLCTTWAPSQPLIYRIARWTGAPSRVTTSSGAVGVNASWGTLLPALASETAVDASTGGWFYDAARRHLIVKLTQLGSACPGGLSSSLPGLLGP